MPHDNNQIYDAFLQVRPSGKNCGYSFDEVIEVKDRIVAETVLIEDMDIAEIIHHEFRKMKHGKH